MHVLSPGAGLILLILLSLATHRVTRIVTRDTLPLIAEPREAFVSRWGTYADAPDKRISINSKRTNVVMRSAAYLWECDWCASVWVSALLTFLSWRWTPLGDEHTLTAVLTWLAAASVSGLIAQREPD